MNSADAKRPSDSAPVLESAPTAAVALVPVPPAANGNGRRRTALLGVGGVVVLAGIVYGTYWALVLNHYESTDNAYVQGNVVQLTPQVDRKSVV